MNKMMYSNYSTYSTVHVKGVNKLWSIKRVTVLATKCIKHPTHNADSGATTAHVSVDQSRTARLQTTGQSTAA